MRCCDNFRRFLHEDSLSAVCSKRFRTTAEVEVVEEVVAALDDTRDAGGRRCLLTFLRCAGKSNSVGTASKINDKCKTLGLSINSFAEGHFMMLGKFKFCEKKLSGI